MSWPSSQTLLPTVLVVCAALAWWFTEPKTAHLNLIVAIGFGLFFWAVAPGLAREVSANIYAYCMTTITQSSLDTFVADNATMLLTGAAVVWYVAVPPLVMLALLPRIAHPARAAGTFFG